MTTSIFQPIRDFRAKLARGRFCLGTSITLSDPAVTESVGRAGDFIWFDLEHTPMGLESLQAHLMAARAIGVPGLVRVPASEEWMIKRVLDTGAGGIIVPQVGSVDEVRRVVDACRYQPLGRRGYGPRRASDFGYDAGYLDTINQDLFVCVQIENQSALSVVDGIAAVPGLDSLALGPFDLAASMGFMRRPETPEVQRAIQRVIDAARAGGKWVGMGGPADEAYVARAAGMGIQWLQAGTDFEYMSQFVSAFFRQAAPAAREPGAGETGAGSSY